MATMRPSVAASPGDAPYVRKGELVLHVEDYGAVVDGVTDDTDAIQAALDAADATWGATVQLGNGVSIVGTLTIPAHVTLRGLGRDSSVLKAKAALDAPVITAVAVDTERVALVGFSIDGNKDNQSSAAAHGISLTSTGSSAAFRAASTSDAYDPAHLLADLYVWDCKGSGVKLVGRGESRVTNVTTYRCDEYGFDIATQDSHFTDCTSGESGKQGFIVQTSGGSYGSNNRFTGCNAWYSGQADSASGDGWIITAGRNHLTGCQAQDNKRHGFLVSACEDVVLSGVLADSNGTATSGDGINLATSTGSCYVSGETLDRGESPTQRYGVYLASGVSGCMIDLVSTNNATAAYSGTLTGNYVRINGVSTYQSELTELFVSAANIESPSAASLSNVAQWAWWLLDASSAESVATSVNLPPGWTTFNVKALWANASSGSGDVVWQLQYATAGAGSNFSTGTSSANAVTGTAGAQYIGVLTTVGSGLSAPAAGSATKLRLIRQAADAGDTLANDVGLIGLILTKAT